MHRDNQLGRTRHLRRGWYMLSVDALRGWAIGLALVALAGVVYLVHGEWQSFTQQRDAVALIAEAEDLVNRLQTLPGLDAHRADFASGRGFLSSARRSYERGDMASASASGRDARNTLLAIFNTLVRRTDSTEAGFISVYGDVEYRRGESGDWQSARSRVALASGDFVRTGANGSAEISFADGTLYTVRPNTSFVVSRSTGAGNGSERSITMEYGWVNLNTATLPALVDIPTAEARVEEESEAFVSYERESNEGRVGAFRGGVEVTSGEETRRIGALQEVVQSGEQLSQPKTLPGRPEATEPPDNLQVDSDRVDELVLGWLPVPGAVRYGLQISRNQLFGDNVIDVEDRVETTATLGLKGDGSFLWRVRGIGREGAVGPWSQPRKFRVATSVGAGGRFDGGDDVPPSLDLEDVSSYGNIILVGGRTEAGATVEIDGEPVKVAADGTFTKTVQLNKEGYSIIEVRARDAWGNVTTRRRRVFVDVP